MNYNLSLDNKKNGSEFLENTLSIQQNIKNLKQTSEFLLSLDENVSQSNGWTLREILLHIWSWDEQMIDACEAKIAGATDDDLFDYQKQGIEMDLWNEQMIEQKKDLSLEEVKKLFKETREKTIKYFEKFFANIETIEDEESFLRFETVVVLWQHDKHHIEQAGQKVSL
ncbi:MAG: ClbS/DfsB family four-helix bundle protein [Candidatus Heimdallarchaeota archaeon]|nr:ClbS/DfsB family four-helix bundle protein [Candidatus Heimdallarchaeota archaeon]